MPSLLYCTPRALMMQYLEDNSHPHLVQWYKKDEEVLIDGGKMMFEWLRVARPDKYSEEDRKRGATKRENGTAYLSGILASAWTTKQKHVDPKWVIIMLVKNSTTQRFIANHFVGNKLIEWIIQFLLEQTYVDYIQWTDKDNKQFQLLDINGLAKMYTNVQNVMSKSPEYYIKLLLSTYCNNGVLIQIDKKKHIYQFNVEWYEKEKNRTISTPIQKKLQLNPNSINSYGVAEFII